MKNKVVLAYSGDMNSTACIIWMKENLDCDVIAVCVDVGQIADWKAIKKRALTAGAKDCHIADVKKEYVTDYLLPLIKAGAAYQALCLPGVSVVQALVAKTLADYAHAEKAAAIAHGGACCGSTMIRLHNCLQSLVPEIEIIVPRLMWKFKTTKEVTRYLARFLARTKMTFPAEKKNAYKRDGNLWYNSCEGLDLEDPANEPVYKKILTMIAMPERAPNKPEYVEIEFEKGIPAAVNGKKVDGVTLVSQLNKIGGANGIGITDVVESSITGEKSRVVYEAPACAILYHALADLERVCFDKHAFTFKQRAAFKMGKLTCYGAWFSPLRKSLSAVVDGVQETVNGKVKLKLYKGSIYSAGVTQAKALKKK